VLVDQERPIELAVAHQVVANVKRLDPTCNVELKSLSSTEVGQHVTQGTYDIYVGSVPTSIYENSSSFGIGDGSSLFDIAEVEQYLVIKRDYFLTDTTLKSVVKK